MSTPSTPTTNSSQWPRETPCSSASVADPGLLRLQLKSHHLKGRKLKLVRSRCAKTQRRPSLIRLPWTSRCVGSSRARRELKCLRKINCYALRLVRRISHFFSIFHEVCRAFLSRSRRLPFGSDWNALPSSHSASSGQAVCGHSRSSIKRDVLFLVTALSIPTPTQPLPLSRNPFTSCLH